MKFIKEWCALPLQHRCCTRTCRQGLRSLPRSVHRSTLGYRQTGRQKSRHKLPHRVYRGSPTPKARARGNETTAVVTPLKIAPRRLLNRMRLVIAIT